MYVHCIYYVKYSTKESEMLKKIVKYGNSSALILDKALLELLNIEVGSVVKIKTDGVSLILTPKHALEQETISPTLTIEGTFNDAINDCLAQSFDGDSEKAAAFQKEIVEITDRYKKVFKDGKASPELCTSESEQMGQELDALLKKYPTVNSQDGDSIDNGALRKEFAEVHKKYEHVLLAVSSLMETPEHIHEMALLGEEYQNNPRGINSKEYFEAYTKLTSKSIPEYADYLDEITKVGEKFASNKQKNTVD